MAKIQIIELKELDVIEVDGEYETRFINKRKVPAALTHYSLYLGQQLGITEGSLLADLIKLKGLEDFDKIDESQDKEERVLKSAEQFDQMRYLQIIYLACKGLNKNFELTFDGFVERYHEDIETMLNTWALLVEDAISSNPNKFAQGLKDSTKKK